MHVAIKVVFVSLYTLAAAAPQTQIAHWNGIRIPLTISKELLKRELETHVSVHSIRARAAKRTSSNANSSNLLLPNTLAARTDSVKRADFGPVALSATLNIYHGEVTVGNQVLQLAFDTGSRYTWVFGPDCTGPSCEGHVKYNPRGGTTARGGTQPFSINYVSGSIDGRWYTDTMTVAGVEASHVSVGAATTVTDHFRKVNFQPDGLFGLALPDFSQRPQAQGPTRPIPLIQILVEEGLIHSAQFAFLFTEHPEVVLGYSNPLAYQGEVTWMDIVQSYQDDPEGHWLVTLDGISVKGPNDVADNGDIIESEVIHVVQHPVTALFDTGSTLCYGPIEQVRAIYAQIEHSQEVSMGDGTESHWQIPCDALEDVILVFGGKSFPFSDGALIFGDLGDNLCMGIISGKQGMDRWSIGPGFLRTVYTIFQIRSPAGGRPRVGLAALAGGNAPADFRAVFGFPPLPDSE